MDFNLNNQFTETPLVPKADDHNALPNNNNSQGIVTNFGGAHLTDFTKRKNWPLRVLGELKDFLHVVSPSGRFLFCSPSCLEMVGFAPEDLVGRQITDFIHVDDIDTFIRDFNLAVNQKIFKTFYRFRKKDDKFVTLEINGHPYFPDGSTTARCFFLMARPYPSKAASMLDSFLELRMENEILTQKLQELQRDSEGQMISGEDSGNRAPTSNSPQYQPHKYPPASSESISTGFTGSVSQGPPSTGFTSLIDQIKKPKKTKRPKGEEDVHVCTDCGTVESPEWRKGPQGPKTLCNACGLRYAKKSRKTLQVDGAEKDAAVN